MCATGTEWHRGHTDGRLFTDLLHPDGLPEIGVVLPHIRGTRMYKGHSWSFKTFRYHKHKETRCTCIALDDKVDLAGSFVFSFPLHFALLAPFSAPRTCTGEPSSGPRPRRRTSGAPGDRWGSTTRSKAQGAFFRTGRCDSGKSRAFCGVWCGVWFAQLEFKGPLIIRKLFGFQVVLGCC